MLSKEEYFSVVRRCLRDSMQSDLLNDLEKSIISIAYSWDKDFMRAYQAICDFRNPGNHPLRKND